MKKPEKTILIKNADYVVTMNKKREILRNISLLIKGNKILEICTKKGGADQAINASGMVIFPGFINTHLHTPQVFHRHCPAQQNKPIARWIQITTSVNREIDEEAMYWGALVCFGELMLSGVTTSLDYFYPFVRGKPGTYEAMIHAASDLGIRLTAIRGSMSQSKKQGTLYDDEVVEPIEDILSHSEKMIKKYHDNTEGSMVRVGVGPCLPFSSIGEDYSEVSKLARKYSGVIMQTHAAESVWEGEYCRKKFGVSPIGLMEKTDFLGPKVSLVHCNIITEEEKNLLGKSKTNVVVTPICNTRDASDGNGIAPVSELLKLGANVSIGTDGPASNDSLNLQDEMRYLRVVSMGKEGLFWHRNEDQKTYSYRDSLEALGITNLGGAKTLNRSDIGSIEVGKMADLAIFNPDEEISHAGAVNKWGAIMSCAPIKPKYLIVNGKIVVKDGELLSVLEEEVNRNFRKFHKKVIEKAQKRLGFNLIEY